MRKTRSGIESAVCFCSSIVANCSSVIGVCHIVHHSGKPIFRESLSGNIGSQIYSFGLPKDSCLGKLKRNPKVIGRTCCYDFSYIEKKRSLTLLLFLIFEIGLLFVLH